MTLDGWSWLEWTLNGWSGLCDSMFNVGSLAQEREWGKVVTSCCGGFVSSHTVIPTRFFLASDTHSYLLFLYYLLHKIVLFN